ncbi:MAG: YbaB/EbfC family nucleoid-associated protein [Candidatus Sumerlaeia bacterium]|nr:YbaB/EbfC family nucleoid-associated protein [Candidatus Sumerlaeia bacterium]
MLDPGMIRRLQGDLNARMEKMQQELEATTVEGVAGGGVVRAVASGTRELKEVFIGPEAIDPDDPEMLQDLIVAAVNNALEKARLLHEEKMNKATGGIKLPGLF